LPLFRVVLVLVLAFSLLGLGVALAYFGSLASALYLVFSLVVSSVILTSSGFHLLLSSVIFLSRVRRGDALWPCGCLLCSLTALRLAGFHGVSPGGFEGSVEPIDAVVEVAEVTAPKAPTSPEPSSQPPNQPGPQVVQQPAQIDEVLEALSNLEGEVRSLKSEFSSSLEEFRNAIMALKSEVDEIRNPFNIMRSVAEFLDEDTKNAILALAGLAGGEEGHGGGAGKIASLTTRILPGRLATEGSWGFLELLDLILWLDSIYGSKDWDDLKDVLELLGSLRVVPEAKLRALRAAMSFVERSRTRGERVSEKVRILSILAKQLSITGGEHVFKLLEYMGRGGR
jgi:hypothetical protein